jgi:3D-(3,5/4)-trihydroxycyclohexane-1,2-dione acylhydrolase (decyclizing)
MSSLEFNSPTESNPKKSPPDKNLHPQQLTISLADAKEALRALVNAAKEVRIRTSTDYQQEIIRVRDEWTRQCRYEVFDQQSDTLTQGQLISAMNEESQSGDTVIAAAGSPPGDLLKLWDATDGRNCHIEFGFSCMGYELPAGWAFAWPSQKAK